MNQATPTRRALVDLPVNTLGTPSAVADGRKSTAKGKRPIDAVAEPEYPLTPSRAKVPSVRPQNHIREEVLLPEVRTVMPSRVSVSPRSVAPVTTGDQEEAMEEMGDEDSQTSYASRNDFDPDDTMISQQTAETELTQPMRSRANQHAETLRLRLRLAHFKVKTNQTHTPLSQLQISTDSHQGSSPTDQPSLPKLLPAPILKPTAYSARNISQMLELSSQPSSPDNTRETGNRENVFRTPALPRRVITAAQAASPLDGEERRPKDSYQEEDNLTSSAVRGKAAIGLLGLRQER